MLSAGDYYPIMMKAVHDDTVVEFVDLRKGTIIIADGNDEIGEYCEYWVAHTDTFIWERYDG